ncbi:protein-methionine sulfoxide oxidase mical2b isoform X2 [Melanotaenia boesemani]|uniref:protein-methionine sulfoxide oxidase mical2b isoform X2 n=1 Tax=Melanotaenia boesemani TaxID=1250792 RepID=UPI001C040C2E|nr:protein-methionine sulfoxide oxidase mical2b isoform X2 [Melanotaenia boesemani]
MSSGMSAVKALQQWCRVQCEGYRDVSITNMTTSFRDGLAFCALIHKHRPDLINFDSLKKDDVYENNKLAFKVAEVELGIPALLDAEDMVALKIPDRLSILTYVSQYYNYFHGRSPIGGMAGIKRPAEGLTDEPPGKKNQPVVSKVLPAAKPARENSPPPSSNITRPTPSPLQIRSSSQDAHVQKSHQTGTLSNKCVSCDKHVHLVQRHLVEGKLYHRNCAKLLSTNKSSPLHNLPTNTFVSKYTPQPDSSKANTVTSAHTPSRLGPTWPTERPSTTPKISSTFSTSPSSWSASGPASKESPAAIVSKPTSPRDTAFTTTSSISSTPIAAPRASAAAAKTRESKLKFLQSDNNTNHEERKTSTISVDLNKGQSMGGKTQEAKTSPAVTVVVNVKDPDKGKVTTKTTGVGSMARTKHEGHESNKAAAAAFISKKLTEENNNNSKPSWMTTALKTTEKPQSQVETPKRETEGGRGRVKLKADPAILADLHVPEPKNSAHSPAGKCGHADKTPNLKPGRASPNTSVSDNESPADWRSKLKPVSKETKPAGPPQSSPKPWSNGAEKTPGVSAGPSSSSPHIPSPSFSLTPPVSKGFQNGQKAQTANGTKSESKVSKTNPDYIPKEDISRELQEIENNLNELEQRGVELEMKLRSCEEEGDDDTLMDELMVEWFNLIRNKQVAMRRESELVYIGKTQDLEEQQPNVELELRRLMEKPEHMKSAWERKREEQLMEKLMEIVNDRNAIVEGLDEDRLREEEEDEQLNKMMMNFSIKKDKPKKKSKLFSWGSKKER